MGSLTRGNVFILRLYLVAWPEGSEWAKSMCCDEKPIKKVESGAVDQCGVSSTKGL